MFRLRSYKRRSRGQSLAEFALVLPILALLIFALLDLGRAVYVYNTLSNAARAGARVAAVNQNASTNGVCDAMDRPNWSIVACILAEGVSIPIQRTDIDIQYIGATCTTRQLDPPCIAQVTVFQDYVPFTPIISNFFGTFHISSTSEMPVEAWYP
jgi:Flp pilus assembly protein TadG